MRQRVLAQDSPGAELPGLDLDRIISQVNTVWDAYGELVLAVAALVVLATCILVWRKLRKVPANRLIALVAVGPTLVWTSHGVWNVAVNALGMSPQIAVFAFLVFEAMLLKAGYEAEAHRRRFGTPGPHGRYVWVIALTTGTVASLGDPTLVGSVARFVLPLVAAGLWWTTLTAPRKGDTKQMIAAREARARGRSTVWAVTPRTVLVAAGIMRPGDDLSMSEAERERRIRRMVVLADRIHSAPADGRSHRRAATRLRRLARLATAEDVAEVRARVARAVGVVTEVVPAAESPAGNQVPQPDLRQRQAGTRTDDRADHAGATAPRGRRNRPRTAVHTPAGVRPEQIDARQTWLASLQQGRPIPGGELGRMSGVDASTGRRWVRGWRAELDTTSTGNDAARSNDQNLWMVLGGVT